MQCLLTSYYLQLKDKISNFMMRNVQADQISPSKPLQLQLVFASHVMKISMLPRQPIESFVQ
ncbi:hypothetical protein Plhal304r1_c023g0078651 [Plasmopara halstedii]